MAEHTKPPYHVDPRDQTAICVAMHGQIGSQLVARCHGKADTAFLCRAANAHEALVQACRDCLHVFEATESKLRIVDTLRAALALAERGAT